MLIEGTGPSDREQRAPTTMAQKVTIDEALLRERWVSSMTNEVGVSCMEMMEVSAARTNNR